jgi:hypothetical protein
MLYNSSMSEEHHHPSTITTHTEHDEVVKTIALQRGEHEAEPLRQLYTIVKHLGTEQALAFLRETVAIEEAGGLLLADGCDVAPKVVSSFTSCVPKAPRRCALSSSRARPDLLASKTRQLQHRSSRHPHRSAGRTALPPSM